MSSLSTTQPDLFAEWQFDVPSERPMDTARSVESPSSRSLDFPQFGAYSGTQAQTARIAGRLAAANVSETERESLMKERQALVDKVLAKTITRRGSIRLEYVRWSLDRIEDAQHGEDFDRLEEYIDRYEHFVQDLEDFKRALVGASIKRR